MTKHNRFAKQSSNHSSNYLSSRELYYMKQTVKSEDIENPNRFSMLKKSEKSEIAITPYDQGAELAAEKESVNPAEQASFQSCYNTNLSKNSSSTQWSNKKSHTLRSKAGASALGVIPYTKNSGKANISSRNSTAAVKGNSGGVINFEKQVFKTFTKGPVNKKLGSANREPISEQMKRWAESSTENFNSELTGLEGAKMVKKKDHTVVLNVAIHGSGKPLVGESRNTGSVADLNSESLKMQQIEKRLDDKKRQIGLSKVHESQFEIIKAPRAQIKIMSQIPQPTNDQIPHEIAPIVQEESKKGAALQPKSELKTLKKQHSRTISVDFNKIVFASQTSHPKDSSESQNTQENSRKKKFPKTQEKSRAQSRKFQDESRYSQDLVMHSSNYEGSEEVDISSVTKVDQTDTNIAITRDLEKDSGQQRSKALLESIQCGNPSKNSFPKSIKTEAIHMRNDSLDDRRPSELNPCFETRGSVGSQRQESTQGAEFSNNLRSRRRTKSKDERGLGSSSYKNLRSELSDEDNLSSSKAMGKSNTQIISFQPDFILIRCRKPLKTVQKRRETRR